MDEQKTFIDSPLTTLIQLIFALVLTFVFVMAMVGIFGPPPKKTGGYWTAQGFTTMMIAIHLGLLLLMILICGFAKRREITCDADGCAVFEQAFFGGSADHFHFRWNEIAETKIVKGATKSPVRFLATFNGQTKTLMHLKLFAGAEFQALVELFNEKTPQLPYRWVKKKSTVRIFQNSRPPYARIERN